MLFTDLLEVNVNEYVEKKSGLSYLSWAPAWSEFKKRCTDATYEIKKFENQLPYVYDPNTGYMVFTSITANNETHEMWLPVMDSSNKAMKAEQYTYDTKYKKGLVVEAATMFDINKTIMRCLVKNMAMFGLGLYIYAGEDLPEGEQDKLEEQKESDNKKEYDRIVAEIKGKWLTLGGKEEGLQSWIDEQTEKGKSYSDMNAILTKNIQVKQAEAKKKEGNK